MTAQQLRQNPIVLHCIRTTTILGLFFTILKVLPMKIGFHDVNLPEGKVRYDDLRMKMLVEKCAPQKVSPYYVEFMKGEFSESEAIVISKKSVLDLLINDIEKCESRADSAGSGPEKELAEKCLKLLEAELPICDGKFDVNELTTLRSLGLQSVKPVVVLDQQKETTEVITLCLAKAGVVFFYTVGPKEVHAWPVPEGSDIVVCAGRIHTDLARGFIKGDVTGFDDFMKCHNWNDCQRKGLVRVVDRGYVIKSGEIIEIRFNV
jgi:ribosome-binding ATPase